MLASCFYSFFGKCIHIKPYIISSKIIKNGKLFSTKKVPIILIESVKDIKNMINHIETIYCNNSNNNKEKREKGFFNFEKKKIGIIYLDKNCEKIYNLWNYYDLRNENITKEKNNVNEYKTYHHNDYNRNNKLNHIFKLCSNDDGDMNIMKRNVIGIYVPVERNIFSSKINYFYLFNNLKELTKEINSKNVIDLQYLYQCVISLYNLKILKHDIFATSLVLYPDLYNNILTYEYKKKRGEYKKNESNNNIINKCKQNYRNVNNNPPINIQDGDNLLNKSTRHNIKDKIMNNNLKQAYPDEYFMCRIKKKCVSIYNNNDMNELSNFERQLLHIMYLFPCASRLLIKYKDVEGYHISFKINDILKRYRLLNCIINKFIMNKNKVNDNVNNKEEKKMEGSVICEGGHKERATINKEFIQDCNNSNGYYNKSFDNFNEASDNFNEASYNFNKSSDHSNKSSDHSNKLSDHSNKLSDHFNKSYDHFNKSSETNKQPHMHCNPTLDNYASYQDKLILSLCKQIHIKEDILYEHSLIIGKHIYAYIYEINKTSQNIVFRFNFNLKDIIFKNVICSKNSYDEEDKEENIKTLNGYLQNIYENMFLDDIIIEQRNEHIYNYKNNILVGLLHDKENNFHYFSDKNVGDIVLCTICNISSCGKYIYIERFDTKNLIYIFRKGKYVNLEKNYNYDDINEINEDVLKEIMQNYNDVYSLYISVIFQMCTTKYINEYLFFLYVLFFFFGLICFYIFFKKLK
ncbi:hypothetical protein PFHG_01398 [Plasmodium falciparum HB3]|uniref:Uncharacterized protein n=1 Tax=Plasmodium falciparum (isolate HB3) TaxID=137071 RepID=A0A0L7K965_PLAFX|nr:hypothetical protein PFHG_01398 [Plasmodium falciparum HB3]